MVLRIQEESEVRLWDERVSYKTAERNQAVN